MNRRNIPWRLCRKTGETALSAQQIQYLAVKFELDAGELTLLCADLTWTLDPHNLPRSIIHALTAKREGAMIFKEAMCDISKASALLDGARIQLRSLTMSTSVGEDKYSSPLQGLFAKLIKASVDASIIAELFKEAAKAGMPTTLREPRDKRLIRDERRSMVCGAIVRFWDRVGRKEKYTFDPIRKEISGPLVDFINEIVAFITDPSAQLPGETIKEEIVNANKFLAIERKLGSL